MVCLVNGPLVTLLLCNAGAMEVRLGVVQGLIHIIQLAHMLPVAFLEAFLCLNVAQVTLHECYPSLFQLEAEVLPIGALYLTCSVNMQHTMLRYIVVT